MIYLKKQCLNDKKQCFVTRKALLSQQADGLFGKRDRQTPNKMQAKIVGCIDFP